MATNNNYNKASAPETALQRYYRLKNERQYKTDTAQQQTVQPVQETPAEEQNKGGFLGGIGYGLEKLGLGIVRGLEGVADYIVAGGADLFGQDEYAEKVMTDDWMNYNHADEWYNPSEGWQTVGDITGSIGQMLPSVAAAAIPYVGPALSTGMFMTSAAGNAVSEAAKESGELGGKEWLYGSLSGAAEGAVEKVSGGIGGSAMGKFLGKQLGKTTLGKLGVTFAGEGLEEVASDLIDPALRRVTGVDKDATVDWEQLPKTFLVGGAAGSVMGVGARAVNAARVGGFNNLNALERTAAVNEGNAELNRRAAQGRNTERSEAYVTDMRKRLERSLKKMDADTRARFFAEHPTINNTFNTDGSMKAAAEVSNPAAVSAAYRNAAPSYYQRTQTLKNGNTRKVTLTPTKKTIRPEVQTALNDAVRLTDGRINYVVTDNIGKDVNGFYDRDSGTIYISSRASAQEAARAIVSHEITHSLEGTKEYAALAEYALNSMAGREEYNPGRYLTAYAGAHPNVNADTLKYIVDTERVADYIGKELLSDEQTVRRLVESHESIARRIYNWIKDKLAILTKRGGDKETARELSRALKLYENALRHSVGGVSLEAVESAVNARKAKAEKTVEREHSANRILTPAAESGRYSVQTVNGEQVVVIDTDQNIFEGADVKDYPKIVRKYMLDKFQGKVFPVGTSSAYVNRRSVEEYAYSANRRQDQGTRAQKMRAGTELDNLLKVGEYIRHEADNGRHPDATRGWDYYKTRFTFDGENIYEGIISIKLIDRGDLFYDITQIENTSAARAAGIAKGNSSASDRGASTTSIAQNEEKSTPKSKKDKNIRYSLDKVEQEAVDYFGHTYSWAETGYILTDGSRLDFSGRHEGARGGYRAVDHRDIAQIDTYGEMSGSDAMIDFMQRGNIRIMPEGNGVNLSLRPTKAQEMALSDYVSGQRGEITLDIDNEQGNTVVSVKYPRGTHANKVLQDIRNYFDTGAMPTASEVQRFRYSLQIDSEGRKLTEEQAEYFKDSKVRDKDGKLLVVYHGTKNPTFTVFKQSGESSALGAGIYFAENKEYAKGYSFGSEPYEVYLNITNPYIAEMPGGIVQSELIEKGYDGVYNPSNKFWVAFKPEQIKLTTNKTPTANSDIRYSLAKPFAEQVDDVLAGRQSQTIDLYVSETPDVFVELGFPKAPMLMRSSKVKEILAKHTEMSVELIKQIPEAIQNPLFVLKSKTNPDESVVAITEVVTDKGELIVPVWVNQDGVYLDIDLDKPVAVKTNFVASAYGRNVKGLLEYAADNDGFLYINPDKEKVGELLTRHGLQLPRPLRIADSSISIRQETENVNGSDAKNEKVRYSVNLPAEKGTAILKEVPEEKSTVKERARDLWTNFQVHFSDEQAGVVKAGKKLGVTDIEARTHYARAAYNAAGSMLDEYQRDRAGNKVGDGFKAIWDPIYAKGDTYRLDFYEYLMHFQNIDRLAQGKAVLENVTAADSRAAISQLEQQHPEFKALARKVWKYSDNLLQLRADMGLITQEQAEYMRKIYPHYVPTYRDTDKVQGIGGLSGKYNLAVKTTIKTAKGSTLDILPPDVIIARQTMEVMRAGRVNELIGALYDGAVRTGDSTDIAELRRETLWAPQETKTKRLTHKAADELYETLQHDYGTKEGKQNEVTFYRNGERITLAVTPEVFAGLDAYAPNTEYRNKLIEMLVRGNSLFKKLVTSANPFFLVRNFFRDLQDALFYTKHLKRLIPALGKAYKQIATNGELWQKYKAAGGLSSGLFDYNTGVKRSAGLKAKAEAVVRKLEFANMIVEQAPRLAEFMLTLEQGGTVEQALLDSAEVTTNFSRGGKTAKMLNRTVMPFLNPSIQGWSKLVRTVFGKKNASEWMMLILKTLVLGIGLTALNDLLNGDDEDYEALSLRDKENYYLLKVGDTFLKLPKGRVLSVFGSLYLRGKEAAQGNANAWDGYLSDVAGQVSPVDNMTRTIFSPFTDIATNTTWYGGQIEGRKFENIAPENRYDESTSSIAIALGKVLNYSPKKIHYLIDQYSGVIGDVVLPLTTKRAERNPVAANFTIDPVLSNRWADDFYTALDEANYAKSAGDVTAAYKVRYLNAIAGEVSDMYAEKQQIEASDKADKDKAAESKAIQLLINETQKQAVKGLKTFEAAVQGTGVTEALARLQSTKTYASLSADAQNAAVNRLNDYCYAAAMEQATGAAMPSKYYLYELLGADVAALHLSVIAGIEADKDKAGNTVANSRKSKVHDYIESQRLTALQKYILLILAGYKPAEAGKDQVRRAINRLSVSHDVKADLLELVD